MATLTQAVDAVVNLTNTVDGKVQEIDSRIAAKENEVTQFLINAPASYMNKVMHIDAVNGDDANVGSAAAPLKTLKAAFDKAPYASLLTIRFLSDVTIDNHIYVTQSTVLLEPRGYSLIVKPIPGYANICGGFIPNVGTSFLVHGGGDSTNPSSIVFDETLTSADAVYGALFRGNAALRQAVFVSIAYEVEIVDNSNSAGFLFSFYSKSYSITIAGVTFTGTRTGLVDYCSGIVRDANGVPRNVMSNIVL